jgi:hypothetical protein
LNRWISRRSLLLPLVLAACIPDLQTSGSYCGDGFVDSAAGEECDLGPEKAPGCTSACKIDCAKGFLDPITAHCYLVLPAITSRAQAESACQANGAHLVTFGSEEELFRLIPQLPSTVENYWVGLERDPTTGVHTSVTPEEPGWAPKTRCTGCWAKTDAKDEMPRVGVGTAPFPCVVGTTQVAQPWVQTRCEVNVPITPICEREPPGRTASECGGAVCITLRRTPGKRYEYFRTSATADAAASACASLGGSLVVLESREEREALVREVSGFSKDPFSFWIGLAHKDGAWTWEDGAKLGTKDRPDPWGDREPRALANGTRAYVTAHLGAYDTQLAHADSGGERPYVCQLPR